MSKKVKIKKLKTRKSITKRRLKVSSLHKCVKKAYYF